MFFRLCFDFYTIVQFYSSPDGTAWMPSKASLICSDHFIGGKKSPFLFSPAHNPSLPAGQKATHDDLKKLEEFNA